MAAPAESVGPVPVEPRLGEYYLHFALDLLRCHPVSPVFNPISDLNLQNIVPLVVLLDPW